MRWCWKGCNVEPPVIDDDIAPMHDRFEVMEPEEIRAWELRQWGQVLMNTPWLQPILADLRKECTDI